MQSGSWKLFCCFLAENSRVFWEKSIKCFGGDQFWSSKPPTGSKSNLFFFSWQWMPKPDNIFMIQSRPHFHLVALRILNCQKSYLCFRKAMALLLVSYNIRREQWSTTFEGQSNSLYSIFKQSQPFHRVTIDNSKKIDEYMAKGRILAKVHFVLEEKMVYNCETLIWGHML